MARRTTDRVLAWLALVLLLGFYRRVEVHPRRPSLAGRPVLIVSNHFNGFVDPVIENLTLAQRVATTRDAVSADSELRLQTEIFAVEFSDDDGASYNDDYDLVGLADTQAMLIELEPGNNAIRVTGCSDAVLEWEFDPAYH